MRSIYDAYIMQDNAMSFHGIKGNVTDEFVFIKPKETMQVN